MRARWLNLLVVFLCAFCASAWAEPTIEVRGRLRIELERVERSGRGLVVTGALLDEALGEPMPGWTVALRLGRLDDDRQESFVYGHAVPTDLDGGFRFEVPPLPRSSYVVHLVAPGDGAYAAPTPIDHEIDLARRNLDLRLYAPAELASTASMLSIVIEAVALDRGNSTSGSEPTLEGDLPVDVELDGKPTATLLLKNGRVSSQLALPSPSQQDAHQDIRELTVRARFAGDESRGPAEATTRVRLVPSSAISLEASASQVPAGAVVTLTGTLRPGGRPLGGLPVLVRRIPAVDEDGSLIDGESATATTGPDGAFQVQLRAPSRGRRASFEASFSAADAQQRGLGAATSELVLVEVAPGLSLDELARRPTGAALVVAVGLLLALGALRFGARLGSAPRPEVAAPSPPGAARRLLGTLRLASDRRVGGCVLDSDRHRPLAGVRVSLRSGKETRESLSDAEGRFSFGELPAGAVELHFALPGYVGVPRAGQVPHRGELAALEVTLTPLRSEVLRLYGAALAPYLPNREQLGPRTPRELASLALATPAGFNALDAAAVGALRSRVEDACFGQQGPGPETLTEVAALVSETTKPRV